MLVCVCICAYMCVLYTHTLQLGTRHCCQPETFLFASNIAWTSSELTKLLYREIVFSSFEFGVLKSYLCIIFNIPPDLEMQSLHYPGLGEVY